MGICVSCRRRDLQARDKRAARAGGGRAPAKGAAAELLPRRADPAMANSISNIKMTNPIKGIVSKRRRRYIKDGFNLDLAYITDRLIAMGFPAEKLEGVYRNHIDEVYRFLEQMHKDHYKIYNLCSERCYDSSKFHGRVARYAFEDHTPPKMELIQPFCEDVHNWLNADPRNVAAVHCKAGKGRTGTMLCCYLLYSGQKATADEALKYYGNKRTHDEKGVTIPSQRRYVEYYAALVRGGLTYRAPALHIRELSLAPPPALSAPHCSLELTVSPPNKTAAVCHEVRKAGAGGGGGGGGGGARLVLQQCVPLRGDVRVDVYCKPKVMMRKEKLFHFWFNTFFVANCVGAVRVPPPPDSVNLDTFKLVLNKWQLDDAHKDKQHKLYSPDFKVELIVQQQPAHARCAPPPPAPAAPPPRASRPASPASSASSASSDPEPDSEHWDSGERTHDAHSIARRYHSHVCRDDCQRLCRRASEIALLARYTPEQILAFRRQAGPGDAGPTSFRRASEASAPRPGDCPAFGRASPADTRPSFYGDESDSQDFYQEESPADNGREFYRQASEISPITSDGPGERTDFYRRASLRDNSREFGRQDNTSQMKQQRSPQHDSRRFVRQASEASPVTMDNYQGSQASKTAPDNSQTFRQPLGSVTGDDALSFSLHEGYCCRLNSDVDGTHAYLDFTNRCQCSNQQDYMRLDEFSSGTVCPHGYVRLEGQNAASCQHEHVPPDTAANAPMHTKLSGLANKCKGFFRPISPAERMDVCEVCDDPKQKKSVSKCSKLHMNCLDSNSQKDSHKKLESHVSKDGYILIDRTPRQQARVSDHDCRAHTDVEPSSKCTRLSDPTGSRKGKHIGKDGYMLVDATPRQPPGNSTNTRLQTSPNEFFGGQDMRPADETYMEFTTSDGYMKPVEQAKSNFQDEYALMGPDMSEVTSDKHCMVPDTSPTSDEAKADKSSKNKKHSFFKRDDYKNEKGKIPKVSSDHTISDDKNDKKKYTFFNRREEEGSKPRLSLFNVKWPENRKKKDRDDS